MEIDKVINGFITYLDLHTVAISGINGDHRTEFTTNYMQKVATIISDSYLVDIISINPLDKIDSKDTCTLKGALVESTQQYPN